MVRLALAFSACATTQRVHNQRRRLRLSAPSSSQDHFVMKRHDNSTARAGSRRARHYAMRALSAPSPAPIGSVVVARSLRDEATRLHFGSRWLSPRAPQRDARFVSAVARAYRLRRHRKITT